MVVATLIWLLMRMPPPLLSHGGMILFSAHLVLKIGRTVNPYIHLYVPFLHTPIATVRRWWLRLRDTEDEIRIGLTRSVVQRRKTYIYYVSVHRSEERRVGKECSW